MRIRTAIFVVYVSSAALGFAALMFFILREVRPRYVASIHRTMDDAAKLLAASVAANWSDGANADPAHWARLARALAEPQTGITVAVLTPDGTVLAEASSDLPANPRDGLAKRLASDVLDRSYDRRAVEPNEVRVSAPVRVEGRAVAQVVLARPVRTVNEFVWAERKKLVAGALAIAAVMVAAGWWIAARLTHTIERLTVYVQALRDGKRASPPATKAREVAALGAAFEEMRLALEGRQHLERTTQALAHGIKAPLAAVRGAAELLGEDLPAEDKERFLENLRAESGRIEHIVERLLRLSALEATKRLQHVERLDAAGLLRDVAASFASAAAAAGVELALVEDGPAAGGSAHGERTLLHEALGNFVQNALEFTPRGGRVELRAARQTIPVGDGRDLTEAVVFTVEDSGSGVPGYAVDRVFERFYSLERPSTGRKSTGLGLALVREIAQLHGGDASLENRAAGGARASLRLPAA